MNGISDLDLVAQAMEPTQTLQPNQSNQTYPANHPNQSIETPQTSSTTMSSFAIAHSANQPSGPPKTTSDLAFSSLTPSDRAAVQPLLDALSRGDSAEGDDLKVAEIMKQMDVAGEVADDLEGKLDRLLESLGKVEEEIGKDLPDGGTQGIRLERRGIGEPGGGCSKEG